MYQSHSSISSAHTCYPKHLNICFHTSSITNIVYKKSRYMMGYSHIYVGITVVDVLYHILLKGWLHRLFQIFVLKFQRFQSAKRAVWWIISEFFCQHRIIRHFMLLKDWYDGIIVKEPETWEKTVTRTQRRLNYCNNVSLSPAGLRPHHSFGNS